MSDTPAIGTVGWTDLTVDDAPKLRDFYKDVAGWRFEDCSGDFNMFGPSSDKPVAGICHARGINTGLPAHWLIYIVVEDAVEASKKCIELGGKIIKGPNVSETNATCVIQDPAGAYCVLYSTAKK